MTHGEHHHYVCWRTVDLNLLTFLKILAKLTFLSALPFSVFWPFLSITHQILSNYFWWRLNIFSQAPHALPSYISHHFCSSAQLFQPAADRPSRNMKVLNSKRGNLLWPVAADRALNEASRSCGLHFPLLTPEGRMQVENNEQKAKGSHEGCKKLQLQANNAKSTIRHLFHLLSRHCIPPYPATDKIQKQRHEFPTACTRIYQLVELLTYWCASYIRDHLFASSLDCLRDIC